MARILMADDDNNLLKLIGEALTEDGHRLTQTKDGQTAIQLAVSSRPDLIILDVSMPIHSGLSVLEILRTREETQQIPIILLTSMASGHVYPTIERHPRVAHLKKPVDIEDLRSVIREFLQKYVQN
jgi:CheY-like chemotaxis protein